MTPECVVAQSLHDVRKFNALFRHAFENIGDTPINHRDRRHAQKYNKLALTRLDMMLDAGIDSQSVSDWEILVVIASKRDESVRFCVDYRTFSGKLKPDRWSLLRTDNNFDNSASSKWFSTLDQFRVTSKYGR